MSVLNTTSGSRKIRVLVVDDSPLSLEIFRRMLAPEPEICLVGTAVNGNDALAKLTELNPDVLCTDLHMPGMDGVTLTREVMNRRPMPILVMSTSLQESQKDNIFKMLEAGAVDILAKPLGGLDTDYDTMARDLVLKIKILSGVRVFRRQTSTMVPRNAAQATAPRFANLQRIPPRIICIGASTGGPQALDTILRALPRDFSVPILCVQHMAQGFMQSLVSWLASSCHLHVTTAQSGATPQPGTVYFAADGHHVEIDQTGRFRCSTPAAQGGYCPSVDLAMQSVAGHYRDSAVGVLLTGMGQDGAQGLLQILHQGGLTIAQDEATSIVYGMPRRAFEIGAVRQVLPLPLIADSLIGLTGMRMP